MSKLLCFLASSLALLLAVPAQATVQRAHVSAAFGVDSNTTYNCDAVHPCRFFQTATTVVSSGGEVVALDSGGYGTVNITQSISLIAPAGVYAGISVFAGANGITIGTAGVNVTLRGLTINGMGGTYGVLMTNGTQLNIENSTIAGFTGSGIALAIQTPAQVFVKDSTIKNSDTGILAGFAAKLNISNTSITGITSEGVEIWGGTTGTSTVIASDTLITCVPASSSWGFDNFATPGSIGKMFLDRVNVSICGVGVENEPQTVATANAISISNSMFTSNSIGVLNVSGNTILSSGNNHITGNTSADVTGTITTGTMLH